MSAYCPLCRVDNTPLHQQSGWHLFNANLFSQGKMPIPEDSYTKFESQRHEGGGEQTSMAQDNTHNHNIKSWHFSQIDTSSWMLATLQAKAQTLLNYPHPQLPESIIQVRCTEMVKGGEACIRTRKAKVIAAFETDFKLEARCRINDNTVITAKNILAADCSSDDLDDMNVTNIKPEAEGKEYHAEFVKILRNRLKKDLASILSEILKEMEVWAKDPQNAVIPQLQTPIYDWTPPAPQKSPFDVDLSGDDDDDDDDDDDNEADGQDGIQDQ